MDQPDRTEAPPEDGNGPARLWSRIHEHRMVQWTFAYLAAAYGIQHATVLTSEAFEWPHAVQRITMLLLVFGLPVAVTLAWYQGARASRHFSAGECTIIAILLMIGSTLLYVFAHPTETAVTASQLREASVSATGLLSPIAPAGGVSLAVMPFENLSSDKEQEYFSDGISEEITTALAKIPDLRVVARESAFQFKGKNEDLRTVGRVLGATHLLEGSVRRAGQQLRISAQLVKSGDGVTVWANSYDRELKDVFAVQEDIAHAIAVSLRKPLGLKQGENLVRNRTIDPETYQQYLQARSLVRTRLPLQASNAEQLLEQITARDPDYAPAWALLALAYDVMPQNPAWYSGEATATGKIARDSSSKAEAAARRAIELDPELPDGYASLGRLQVRSGKPLLADESYSKALAIDPNNPDTLLLYGNLFAEAGHLQDALAVMQKLRAAEPFVPLFNIDAAEVIWLNRQNDAAISILRSLPATAASEVDLAEIYASTARYKDAADELLRIPEGTFFPGVIPEAVRLLRNAPTPAASPASILHLGRLSFVYLHAGSPLRALEFHEAAVDAGYIIAVTTAVLWHPSYSTVRKAERFKEFVRKIGLPDYWRAKGWPPQCHPTTGDDFECN